MFPHQSYHNLPPLAIGLLAYQLSCLYYMPTGELIMARPLDFIDFMI